MLYCNNDDITYIWIPIFGFDFGQDEIECEEKSVTAKENYFQADRLEFDIWVHAIIYEMIFYLNWCLNILLYSRSGLALYKKIVGETSSEKIEKLWTILYFFWLFTVQDSFQGDVLSMVTLRCKLLKQSNIFQTLELCTWKFYHCHLHC